MTAKSPEQYGAQPWRHGKCERGVNWHIGQAYCDRRARWIWQGRIFCGTCFREYLAELEQA